jgi:WD40 repeat protein
VDIATGEAVATVPALTNQGRLPFGAGGDVFATIGKRPAFQNQGARAEFRLWETATRKLLLNLDHEAAALGIVVAISPDDRRLVSASQNRTLKLWELATGQELLTLTPGPGGAFQCAFSPDGHLLAASESTGMVRIWDATPMPLPGLP